jgi:hypothetical protein
LQFAVGRHVHNGGKIANLISNGYFNAIGRKSRVVHFGSWRPRETRKRAIRSRPSLAAVTTGKMKPVTTCLALPKLDRDFITRYLN